MEIHQDPQDNDIDTVAEQGDHGIFQVLIPDGPEPLVMGLKCPAQIQDKITGHGPDKGKGGRQKIMNMQQVNGPGINGQIHKNPAAAHQGKAEELVARMAGGDNTVDDIRPGKLLGILLSNIQCPPTKGARKA